MMGRILTAILLFLSFTVATYQGVTALTVSSFAFTPERGGAGTVVHLAGGELYYDEPLTVWLVKSLETSGPGEMITKFQPITKLGFTQPDPAGGHTKATFVIPGRLPDGSPITDRELGIMLTDKNNQQLPELPVKSFEFIPAPLPTTGKQDGLVLMLLLYACTSLTAGLLVRECANRLWSR